MNISIRPITTGDTQNIVKWRNSSFVRDNFIFRQELTASDHEKWMSTSVASGKAAQFIIVSDELGDIGSVYLRDIDNVNRKAEYGIFIGEEDAVGKGIGTIAARLILKYAFEVLQLNRVFLRVFPENKGAIKSYEKAGFVKEGLFYEDVIIDSVPRDMVFMAVLASQYK